jgi:hypothetical protein
MAVVGAAAYFLAHRVLPDPPPVDPFPEIADAEDDVPELEEVSPANQNTVDAENLSAASVSSEPSETLEAKLTRALELLDQQSASIQQASKETETAMQQLQKQVQQNAQSTCKYTVVDAELA